ncbi:LysR family transcriptional regulator [Amycolatopsis granulosa]|uniref:LysR family transcriptional regulator n=1 Tax=Amycolatopsis granulosa TaxID=185684 RepID=UPI0014221F56|nr:LysR family transcriptional regulator [Amycolatopsis granulosa]NIH83316.1 DNA-binding transcriptional LysR family regulator [Amycolatopsis granulosa]
MELRQLRYFVAIFERRSISRAAEHLRISQPALTRQLHQLERYVGTPLFDRVPGGVSPSPAAMALHEHARLVLRLADASREVARSAGPVREAVRVGLPPGVPGTWIERVIGAVAGEVPGAALTVTDASSVDQVRLLREGHLDLGLIHQRPPAPFAARLVLEQQLGLAVRPGHELSRRRRCHLSDLDGLRILAHSRDQVTAEHDRVLAEAEAQDVHPEWVFAWFTENAYACVLAGDAAAALLTRPSAERLLPGWCWIPFDPAGFALPLWLAQHPQTRTVVTAVADVVAATPAGDAG